MGVNVYRAGNIDIWLTPHKTDPGKGWIGIFNRTTTHRNVMLNKQELGFIQFVNSYDLTAASGSFLLEDVWTDETIIIKDEYTFDLPAEGAAFFKFTRQ